MSIDQAVYETLGQYAGLSALVGARIYPEVAPQDVARPYVVWQEISRTPEGDLDGTVSSSGLENVHVQVTCWATTRLSADAVRAQARLAMEAATQFKAFASALRSLGYESDTKLHGAQADFSIWWRS